MKDYIQAKTRAGFDTALEQGKISQEQIAFIEDSDEIWARGKFYRANSDRPYNTEHPNGMGYVVLKKNKTIQSQITTPNTIYEIRYEFDLDGVNLNMPANCVLKFEGGRIINSKAQRNKYGELTNSSIVGNDTLISGTLNNILGNVILSYDYGKKKGWKNLECNLIWWGVKTGEDVLDNAEKVQNAFDSNIPTVLVSRPYYICSPISLPYNKIVKGRTGNNNKTTGFYAGNNFSGKLIKFRERNSGSGAIIPEYSRDVNCMFYHRDTTKSEFHDIFVDGRYKSDFCIEHIDAYGSLDFYNCYICNAKDIGVLQYACENPIIEQLYICDCNIGYYTSTTKYNPNNPFDTSGKSMGASNIRHLRNLRCINCNYGAFIISGSDTTLDNFETAYNYIQGAVFIKANILMNMPYSEGDSICEKYRNTDGSISNSADRGHTLQYLIDNNVDGYEISDDYYFRTKIFYRSVYSIFSSNISINGGFFAYKGRSYQTENVSKIEYPNIRDAAGIDTLFFLSDTSININNIRLFNWSNGNIVGKSLYSLIVAKTKEIYVDLPKIFINIPNTFDRYNTYENIITICKGFGYVPFKDLIYFVNVPGSLYRKNYNTGMENHLTGIPGYFRPFLKNIYVESYKGIPLFKWIKLINNYDGWRYFSKEDLKNLFGNKKWVVAKIVVKILSPLEKPFTLDFRFLDNNNQYVDGSSVGYFNPEVPDPNGYYELSGIIKVDCSKEFNYAIFTGPFNRDNILCSDIMFYDIGDMDMAIPTYSRVRLESGKSSDRPLEAPNGTRFFDETLGKPIYALSTSPSGWVDANGNNADLSRNGDETRTENVVIAKNK